MPNLRLVAVAAAVLMLGSGGAATAKTHRRHAHKHAQAKARGHKRAHALPRPPADSAPDMLTPQIQITQPHASAAPEPAQLEPPASAQASAAAPITPASTAVAPEPAQLELPRPSSAPQPALLASVPPPRPSHLEGERRRRWGLVGGGLAMFVVGYGADVGLTYGLHHEPATSSLIPFAGPLVQLRESWAMVAPANTGNPQIDNQANPRIASVNGEIQTAAYAALAIDCAIQLVGAGLTVAGVVGNKRAKFAAIEPGGSGVRVRF